MNMRAGVHFLVVILIALCGVRAAGQPTAQQTASIQDAVRLRKMTMGIILYMHEHNDRMPPDLFAVSPYVSGDLTNASSKERAAAIREAYFTGADQGMRIPDDADAAWLAKNSSYEYLAGPEFKSADLAGWDQLALVHLKFDRGLAGEPTQNNPEGELFTVSFLDSRVELMGREAAEAVVAESKAVYEALRTGKPLPESHQAMNDLRAVMEAVTAYAKAHGGRLPPTLGATLEFVPVDGKRRVTAADRAKVFLSPRARSTTHVPEEPTAEWVNERTSWVYLGGGEGQPVALSDLEDPNTTILVHGKFDSPLAMTRGATKTEGIPLGTVSGVARLEPEEYARWIADVSGRVVESARSGAPLPDHLHAFRDVRLLMEAVRNYTQRHDGLLPATLGDVLPHVLPGASTEARARVFLSPAKERSTDVPETLTAEWVAAKSSYVYLPAGSVNLRLAIEAGAQVLVHGPIQEPYTVLFSGGTMQVVATGMAFNFTWLSPASSVERMARESAETLKALREATKGER